jgi:saccharopine dehydrogenase-like NADP-dependent oxidoreductase
MKRVLVLGAGLVARPLVRYLLDHDFQVTVATRTVAKATKLIDGHAAGEALTLDLKDEAALERLIEGHDLAVSLVPYAFHPVVARLCIGHRKPMVTTSYVSPEMEALDGSAREAGVTVLNEIGVDPGIDHMSAMRIIDAVRKQDGTIVAFRSYCGGLPAPDDNDNPFGYKFSWAPRGVLLASRNSGRYLRNGRVVDVPAERLFRDVHVLHVPGGGDFEAYPNRDSIGYIDVYGLRGIQTMYRGTLRNMGWCDTLFNFRRLGLLDIEEVDTAGQTYADFTRKIIGAGADEDLQRAVAAKLGLPPESLPVLNLRWLGMFSERPIEAARTSPLDALGALMFEKLAFRAGERDMIVLFHDFEAAYPDGRRERITSTMVDLGVPNGDSSMSRTVSLPAAVATRMILEGRITTTGVLRPVARDVYDPVLDELQTMGISCVEKVEPIEVLGSDPA